MEMIRKPATSTGNGGEIDTGVGTKVTVWDQTSKLADTSNRGLMTPAKGEFTMTVTSTLTGWSTTNAIGIYYQDQDGNHRLKFNIRGTITSATLGGGNTITIAGVVFAFEAAASAFNSGTSPTTYAICQSGVGIIGVGASASATTDRIGVSGDVKLSSKPAWA